MGDAKLQNMYVWQSYLLIKRSTGSRHGVVTVNRAAQTALPVVAPNNFKGSKVLFHKNKGPTGQKHNDEQHLQHSRMVNTNRSVTFNLLNH